MIFDFLFDPCTFEIIRYGIFPNHFQIGRFIWLCQKAIFFGIYHEKSLHLCQQEIVEKESVKQKLDNED